MSDTSSSSLERGANQIQEDGYYMVPDDGRWGAKIDRIKADKYRIEMPHTLEVFSDSTYRNETVRRLLVTIVERPVLSAIQFLSDRMGKVFCSMGGSESDLPRSPGLQVLAWSSGSEGIFHRGSHHQDVGPIRTEPDIGWLDIPRKNLSEEGAQVVPFPKGALLVTDVRLGFEVSKGRVMVVAFHPQKLRDRFHFAETKLRTSDSVIIEKVDIIRTEAIERGIVVEIGISSAS